MNQKGSALVVVLLFVLILSAIAAALYVNKNGFKSQPSVQQTKLVPTPVPSNTTVKSPEASSSGVVSIIDRVSYVLPPDWETIPGSENPIEIQSSDAHFNSGPYLDKGVFVMLGYSAVANNTMSVTSVKFGNNTWDKYYGCQDTCKEIFSLTSGDKAWYIRYTCASQDCFNEGSSDQTKLESFLGSINFK